MLDPNEYLAQALKAQRQARGWSLDQTARETGVSKAMLGQIERGESSPTIATLWKIATGFNVALSEFTDPRGNRIGNELRQAGRLRHQPAADQMLVASLFPYDPAFGFELFELTLLPGYERLSEPHAQGVTEHVIVIRGDMELLIDGNWQRLQEGDAVRFPADGPHGYRNFGQTPAVFHNLIHYCHDREQAR
ncbi:XRE family transcriptional regulator [Marinobacterium sp. D7]|uniref:helix-turn-helix domain-containing protein n=1 Tax=Marinobacterium ramblicola TaxID=2849041 RepID=UPI001C2D6E21|nr:XRE family transcriptional regulator [Marinobacterium ramblicola]MBV1790585.1 XRE family transcriptional regulator [Marinobacterium ramblicola]